MQPGFCIIHANQLETLASLAIAHSQQQPLAPLEREIFLVQSNGMADWLKLQQAQATGISACHDFPMPASFLWQMYQRVLQPSLLDAASPFAKDSLQWRILRLLPELLSQPEFARPARFLAQDASHNKSFQLAHKLADLFDQYQLYRADWISAWEEGRLLGLGMDEAWQAALWRSLIASLPEAQRQLSRAHLHQAFLDALDTEQAPAGLPRRLYLFGINSLPKQLLEALFAMSRHCQLLLMVLSPCREYWGDKGIADLAAFNASNPLLDAWGAQGRDLLKLLQSHTPSEAELALTQEIEGYAGANAYTRADSIICELQQSLLDNRLPSLAALPDQPGLGFYPAYSRQREVEVLHDQLLTLFAEQPELQYSDVLVMMPNIDDYVAHLQAVFDRYPPEDARHLAYAISDRSGQDTPLAHTLDYLLTLPSQRFTLSDVLSLLELPALRLSLGISSDDLPQLRDWCEAAHIRWALDAEHKQQLLELNEAAPAWRAHNSWQAGLDQLLAGYSAGSAAIFSTPGLDEVGANSGWLLGQLAALVERLARLRKQLTGAHSPSDWGQIFRDLLTTFFVAESDDERLLLNQYQQALEAWLDHCALAEFTSSLPLTQARQGWLDQLTQAGLSQQLSFNGITCCTLMPMRALPFKHVFLLGMNDGDYPHETPQLDFDLMQSNYRPGDRDRRSDDHYLFLEALMSVRDSLYISWIGHDLHKHEPRPPCTLVAQLCDLVDRSWHTQLTDADGNPISASAALTQQLPLAAFGQDYFKQAASGAHSWPSQKPARSYASEWFSLYQAPATTTAATATATTTTTTTEAMPAQLELRQLITLLKAPEQVFYQDRLQVREDNIEPPDSDDEPFAADGLTRWQLRHELLTQLMQGRTPNADHWLHNGALPVGELAADLLQTELNAAMSIHRRWQDKLPCAQALKARELRLTLSANGHKGELTARLGHLYQQQGQLYLAATSASNLQDKNGWRFDKLASVWVAHLAACAAGLEVHSLVVARDAQAHLLALTAPCAQQHLNLLYLLYQQAWQQPLVVNEKSTSLAKDADLALAALTETQLLAQIEAHWPDPDDTEPDSFFAELLYRPLALALDDKTTTGEAHD